MSHGGARNWVTHIYVSNGGGVLEDRLVLRFISIPAFLQIIPFSERAGETLMPAAFRRLKATESGRVTPMCAVHASFILTLLTMSNTMGFKESSRQQDCCHVPTIFPSKHTLYNAHSVSRAHPARLDAPSRAGQRMAHAAAVANAA